MYTVTRQRQFPDGNQVVEVSTGTRDYCNPDALCEKYNGEMEEFFDPRKAVEIAITIVRAWRRASGQKVSIGFGNTHGDTMPFAASTFKNARAWAKAEWNELEKCPGCSNPMGKEKWHANDWDGLNYCSERCATCPALPETMRDRIHLFYSSGVGCAPRIKFLPFPRSRPHRWVPFPECFQSARQG